MRDFLFLKHNSKFLRIFVNDLMLIEASDKYVRFVTVNKSHLVLGCLSRTETLLPAEQFCRIHRSYIVSFRHIEEFTSETVCISGYNLPLARQYRSTFFERAEILCADGGNIKQVEKPASSFQVKNIPAK